MPIRVAGTLPDNFPDPDEFKPERWSRKNKDAVNVFGSLPFGFGVRMCVGKQQLRVESVQHWWHGIEYIVVMHCVLYISYCT